MASRCSLGEAENRVSADPRPENEQEDAVSESGVDDHRWQVVLNDEEQYSIWWAGRELPAGWRAEGTEGTKSECLSRIEAVWTDMRPLSLRKRMAAQEA